MQRTTDLQHALLTVLRQHNWLVELNLSYSTVPKRRVKYRRDFPAHRRPDSLKESLGLGSDVVWISTARFVRRCAGGVGHGL